MKDRTLVGGSLVAALGASLCCILPIIFALAGAGVVGASAFFAAWRPYLLAVTLLLLGLGFYFAYRRPSHVCEPGSACSLPVVNRSGRIGLWIVSAIILVVAAFPFYSEAVARLLLSRNEAKPPVSALRLEQANFMVEGMDCTACASTIEKKLQTLDGVQSTTVSYEQKRAIVEFDSKKLSVVQLQQAIQDAGYRARLIQPGGST